MRHRLSQVVAAVIMVFALLTGGMFSAASQSGGGHSLFSRDDLNSELLATTDLNGSDLSDLTLTLELIIIPSGGVFAATTGSTPEVIAVLSGRVSIQDSFGFGSELDEALAVGLGAGTDYQIINESTSDAELLRAFLATPVESNATPVVSPQASPVSDIARSTLVEINAAGMSTENSVLFIGRADLPTDATTGEQLHAGPVMVFVESGTISLVSPSGLQGDVPSGQAVALPAQASLIAQATDSPSSIYVAGISSLPPFTEIVVPPTPTPKPSPTPIPSPTPEPTVDPALEQGVLDWLTNYTTLRDACDTFGVADLYAEPNTDTWAWVQSSFDCTDAIDSTFYIIGEPDIRITGDQATLGFTWQEERLWTGSCHVFGRAEVIQLVLQDGQWRPVDDRTFGERNSNRKHSSTCEVLTLN